MKIAVLTVAFLLPTALLAQDWPRSFESAGHRLTIESAPQRVVSTSASLTGILLALDAPLLSTASAVTGPLTDETGFFSQWADVAHAREVTQLYPNLAFDLESLILADPDLVVISATGGDSVLPHLPEIEALGFNALVVDYSVASWEEQATLLSQALGREAEAQKILTAFQARVETVRDKIIRPAGDVSIVAYNFAGSYGVSKPSSAQARLLAQLGFTVQGLPSEMASAVTRSGDFDFVSLENLAPALSGESIFVLNGTDETVAQLLADPVLAHLPAVQAKQVYPLGPTSFRIDYYSGLQLIDLIDTTFSPK